MYKRDVVMFDLVSLTVGISSDPDGKTHHVQPTEKPQVRPEQKHPGHRRQRQDPVLRQALPHADAQQLCGH